MATKKAGCILVNTETKMIGLIYREKQKDFSFPKGHLEAGESLQECAVRETAEETKRDCKIVFEAGEIVENYVTPSGEQCENHMFLAVDQGKSNNDSTDTHDVVWTAFNDVEQKLSYPSLKVTWNHFKSHIEKLLQK